VNSNPLRPFIQIDADFDFNGFWRIHQPFRRLVARGAV
jgi:hypothetical protein